MLKVGDVLNGKYKILTLVGRGGMSRVWLGQDITLGKVWAIKEINKHSQDYRMTVNERQTLSEIEIMKKLNHSALPRIVDIIDSRDTLCVVMDYIEGETLLQILKKKGRIPEDLAVKWMLEVCNVLDYLHHQNPPIIYRDMKPSNVMLSYSDQHIKVIDFGIAREYKSGRDDTMPLGTRGYASPEHFTQKTDARSDVYTVGVTLWQLVTGRDPAQPPYELKPIREIDPHLSSGLEKIIIKATKPDPDDRYQTAQELADALVSYKKLEEPYLNSVKKKLRHFKTFRIASVLTVILGIGLIAGGTVLNNNTYNQLINANTVNHNQRISELQRAAELKPKETEPYTKLIETYADDEKFTEQEAADFADFFNRHKADLKKDGKKYAELNYDIGEAYLRYYTGETDNSSRAKLIASEPYFKAACVKSFDRHKTAEDYVFMAKYYREYVIADSSLVSNQASLKDYDKLLKSVEDIISSYGEGADKMQTITSDIILNLLDDQRSQMATAGVEEKRLLKDVDDIKVSAQNMAPTEAVIKQEQTKIIGRCDEVRGRIDNSYTAVRKKGVTTNAD